MGIRAHLYDCTAVQVAWNYSNYTQATQAWTPWEEKLRKLIRAHGLRRAILMCLEIQQEIELEHFDEVETPELERRLNGRADRPVPASRPDSVRAVRP